ncbi:hypothetical protein L7F22_001300 [Adiantum nelumboides]|nr:hypothetical protein [Adiantum nelumboides]
MVGDGYEVFIGGKAKDVDKFIRRIESTALKSNRDDGAFKVCLVGLLLEGEAHEWYEDRLEYERKANWYLFSQALKEELGRVDNPEEGYANYTKEDSVRENMADMLTFKEINVKYDMKKDLERKIVPSPTTHEELQEVEVTLYFDEAFKRSINKGAAGYVFFDKNGVPRSGCE